MADRAQNERMALVRYGMASFGPRQSSGAKAKQGSRFGASGCLWVYRRKGRES